MSDEKKKQETEVLDQIEEAEIVEDITPHEPSLVPVTPDLSHTDVVRPAISAEEFKKAWEAYEKLKEAICTPEDLQTIGGKTFRKKSYWKKIATAFNLNVIILSESKEDLPAGDVLYNVICRATAPNGRFADGDGMCNRFEKRADNSYHNARSTAVTRAANRAISNLVGGGEVSAEEADQMGISQDNNYAPRPVKKPSPTQSVFAEYTKQKDEMTTVKESKVILAAIKNDVRLSDKQKWLLSKLTNEKVASLPKAPSADSIDDLPF